MLFDSSLTEFIMVLILGMQAFFFFFTFNKNIRDTILNNKQHLIERNPSMFLTTCVAYYELCQVTRN